ncbi:hypothetical protein SCIP_0243 [Scardovia inopinata JCM 12537]|nr:hypothetical protein SCIP_0243 [Scardovia inopinata JCM 12537]
MSPLHHSEAGKLTSQGNKKALHAGRASERLSRYPYSQPALAASAIVGIMHHSHAPSNQRSVVYMGEYTQKHG